MNNNHSRRVSGGARIPQEVLTLIFTSLVEAYEPTCLLIEPADDSTDDLRLRSLRRNVPAVLHVSREARGIGLRRYRLAFGAVDGRPQFFDFGRDTLYVNSRLLYQGRLSLWVAAHAAIVQDLVEIQELAVYIAPDPRSLRAGEWIFNLGRFFQQDNWRRSFERSFVASSHLPLVMGSSSSSEARFPTIQNIAFKGSLEPSGETMPRVICLVDIYNTHSLTEYKYRGWLEADLGMINDRVSE
ncbi:uncharacterized protein LY89DRAFT_718630 [Mollisia scopiformis]|uniref:2EXR domain-containing protein n=1 Tax=Mollisia scopiformis TaxID=149040 RepID=A0A194X9R4_MOLSC|nr:uncharacterized protein LY89DRAFT_718630 [Mollisia scopiformis]KUJ16908.1 hypothetical protein LY89DRAFT_718630 [Mollisia scopiformis]